MRDPRRSTAIVQRSLPRTAALWPVGNGFAGEVFVAELRTGQVSFRRAFRLVGKFKLGSHTPEALEIVIAPGLLAENVYYKAAEIQQRPFCGAMSLAMFGRAAKIFMELGLDLDRKSTRLNSSHGYISYAVFCERARRREVQHSDARGFL